MKFTHLHVHSHYSLLDGLPKIDELLDYVKALGMDAVALTDHGALYGAIEFFRKAKERGIKPIIGAELYVALEGMEQRRPNIDDKRHHLVLLVKNDEGYKNLVQLITKAHLEGFYYKPRIDEDFLSKHAKGLIALSACLQGKIPRLILSNKITEAENLSLKYQEIFGKDNFFLEIQHHPNSPDQEKVNQRLINISKKYGIPLVATNDIHYLKKEDAEAQDILMLINTGADLNDPERLTLKADDFSMRSPGQMAQDFKDSPEAIENTQKIVDLCNFQFELGKIKLPCFPLEGEKTADGYLKELCLEGLKKRYQNAETQGEVMNRLNYELSVIQKTGFASYFLIVQDFVNWAKQNRIVVGPGRGSAPGSLVAYLLNITSVDPLKYKLLFERFLTSERISLPDIDLDFTDRRRNEVINYVAQKYGKDNVAQIITFGTMAARAVIRDVGRALGYAYSYCDQIAKMIPFGFTLDDTLRRVSEFREMYETDNQAKKLIDLAKKLEGVARHASTHACGVVISPEPLSNYVPLQHPTQDDEVIVTQYEMRSIENLGLLKMDLLGLKNLTIIEDTLSRIYVIHNKTIDIENIPSDDKKTFKLLQTGETVGVFQLESAGIQRYLKQLKPTELEDIIAMAALYRPGPMALIPEYIKGKHKKKPIEYIHPALKPILENTYGIIVYQEQLMEIVHKLAGFSLTEADILRKAIGKKISSLLIAQKEKFINGMKKNNIGAEIGQRIWNWILPFAGYGFNRCLTGDTEIIDGRSGRKTTLGEIAKGKNLSDVISLNKNLKLQKSSAIKVFKNGVKPVYEITTRLGKKIKATLNHPFLTIEGWKVLGGLKPGDRIALARRVPVKNKRLSNIKDYQLIVLGYILAEGNLCHPHGFYFYSTNQEELRDYENALKNFKNTKITLNKSKKAISIYAGRIDLKKPSEAVEWMKKIGMYGKKSIQKEFPEFVFRLNAKQISLLLAKMFEGDGCINLKRKYPQIFYATSSPKLAYQLQHLLLRLGIISTIHFKNFKYRGEIKKGYTLTINRYENFEKLYHHLGHFLLNKKREALEKIIKDHPIISGKIKKYSARGSKDVVPVEIRKMIREEIRKNGYSSLKRFAKEAGFSERLLWMDAKKNGYLRETLQMIGEKLNSKIIRDYAYSDLYWDEIIKITPVGKEETYDLTIKGTHNFLANDFIVHNSHAVSYATIAYQTAYLKANFPVEFMAALLTSEKADVERIGFLIGECKKMGIEILPPDINESLANFTVVPGQNQIRFGLTAIKNVGQNIVKTIVQERKEAGIYQSITDFVTRVNSKDLNKKSLESLIKTGVFDKMAERNQLLFNLERLLEWSREIQRIKNNHQRALFSGAEMSNQFQLLPATPASKNEKLNWEKELLGLFISSHPLEGFKKIFDKVLPISKITTEVSDRSSIISSKGNKRFQRIKIGGVISKIKKVLTRIGKPMLFLSLEDQTDKIEVIVFPAVIERNPAIFQENKIVLVSGRVDSRDGVPKLICEEIEEIINTD